ncbi:MAG: sugar phosphate isomerase/epimerase [Clostridia bacterium]|nr:sugar phosphate isomerase/epimerase [Clostridia bacterium]
MAHPILCSTGAIVGRVNGRDHRLIMKYCPLLRCDGMEFMMYGSWYDKREEVARDLAASGISFPAMHVDKSVGDRISRDQGSDTEDAVRDFGWNCEVADLIGAKQLVLHLWGNVDSDRHIEHNYRVYERLARIARGHDLELTVENVVCSHGDPMTHLREMRDLFPDCGFTIDTKMSAFHGQMPLFSQDEWAWLWTEGRVRHLHVNDYRGGVMDWSSLKTLFIGDGQIDFDAFFQTAGRYGYEGSLTCECTAMRPDGSVDIDRMNESLDAVRALSARYLDKEA